MGKPTSVRLGDAGHLSFPPHTPVSFCPFSEDVFGFCLWVSSKTAVGWGNCKNPVL